MEEKPDKDPAWDAFQAELAEKLGGEVESPVPAHLNEGHKSSDGESVQVCYFDGLGYDVEFPCLPGGGVVLEEHLFGPNNEQDSEMRTWEVRLLGDGEHPSHPYLISWWNTNPEYTDDDYVCSVTVSGHRLKGDTAEELGQEIARFIPAVTGELQPQPPKLPLPEVLCSAVAIARRHTCRKMVGAVHKAWGLPEDGIPSVETAPFSKIEVDQLQETVGAEAQVA